MPVLTPPPQQRRPWGPRCTRVPSTISAACGKPPQPQTALSTLAYKHEEMNTGDFAGAGDADLRAIEVLGEALTGTGKPFIGTSGTLMLTFSDIAGTGTGVRRCQRLPADPKRRTPCSPSPSAASGHLSSASRQPCTARSITAASSQLIAIARERATPATSATGQPLARGCDTLDAASLLPPGGRGGAAGSAVAPRSRGGRAVPGDRRGHRAQPGCAGRELPPGGRGRRLRFLALRRPARQPHLERADPEKLLSWHPAQPGIIDDLDQGRYSEA